MSVHSRDMQVFEILDEISKMASDELKIQHLANNYSDHTPLHYILKFNYCDTIKSILPEGEPPFNSEEEDGPSRGSLWNYLNHFPMFVVSGQSANTKAMQRERMFIEMCEAVDPEEAKMFCLAKDRALETKYNINVNVATAAFPNLQIQSSAPVKEATPEERAASLTELAKKCRSDAKELQAQARDLEKQAKELTSGE